MRLFIKFFLLASTITCVIFNFYGCAFKTKFTPLREMPPEALKMVYPSDVEVLTGEPPIGKEYIEIGYITIDESWASPIMTQNISEEDIMVMARKEAANHGADAVIKFSITGEHPARRARGIAIVYKKRRY